MAGQPGASLLIFRSRDDYVQQQFNGYLDDEARAFLVKKKVELLQASMRCAPLKFKQYPRRAARACARSR